MSNTFLTEQTIARQALLRLRENTVMAQLVHRDFSNDFSNKGDTITVKRPNTFVAQEFNGTVTTQNITEGNITVTLDKIADVSVGVSSKELTLNINDFTDQIVTPAMQALAQKIDTDLMGLYADIPYYTGTSGTTPDDLDDFAQAARVLNDNNVPMVMRSGVWNPSANAKFGVIPAIVNAEKSGTTTALREGAIGRIQGLDNYMSQNIKTHAAGGFTSLNDVTVSATKGATTITMTSAAGSATTSLKKGDLFTLGGFQYVVTADTANASSGSIASVAIYPAIKATVSSGSVTFPDRTARAHVSNLAFHKNAFALVSRPLAVPQGGAKGYVVDFEGLAIRVTLGYDMNSKTNLLSFDTLYGVKTLQQELATRVLG